MTLKMRLRQYGRALGVPPWPKHHTDDRGVIPLYEKDKNQITCLMEDKISFRVVKIICDLTYFNYVLIILINSTIF